MITLARIAELHDISSNAIDNETCIHVRADELADLCYYAKLLLAVRAEMREGKDDINDMTEEIQDAVYGDDDA